MAKTPRTWTGARTPSGLKRVRQAERRHAILQPRRTAAKTFVSNALIAATAGGDAETTAQALADAHAALDRAAKVGAIHPNAAARRKSRLTLKFNAAAGGAHVQSGGRVTKTTSKAQAATGALARIAVSKADKAKGAQTAAGKARAALTKTTRTEGTTTAQPTEAATPVASKARATKPAAKTATAKKAPAAKAKAAAPKATAKKATAKKATAKAAPKKRTAKG